MAKLFFLRRHYLEIKVLLLTLEFYHLLLKDIQAQLMLRLDNDGGVIGDVSYLAPDAGGYALPQYWRFTLHGSDGLAETAIGADGVALCGQDAQAVGRIPPAASRPGGYLRSFLNEIAGAREDVTLSTREVLASARLALLTQRAADEGLRDLPCP